MGLTVKSDNSNDELRIDPTSKAARVTLYDPNGTIDLGYTDFGSAGNLGFALNSEFIFTNTLGYSSICFRLTIPLGATVSFKASFDGTTYENLTLRQLGNDGYIQSSSESGAYIGSISCARLVKVLVTAVGTVIGSVVGRATREVSTIEGIENAAPDEFFLNVAEGLINGIRSINRFGRNQDVDIGTEDVWGSGGVWTPPTTAGVVNIVSSSAADTVAGTGARTLRIMGLNGSYAEVSETITLNGTTPVPTLNQYFIIHNISVMTAGTGNTNAGTITSTSTGGGTPTMPSITIGKAETQFCFYQVPAGFTAYLENYQGGINGGALCDLELFAKPFGGVYNLKGTMLLNLTGNSYSQRDYKTPIPFTEKTIIKLSATASANNTDVVGSFDLILVAN